jgi:hypothetical protein
LAAAAATWEEPYIVAYGKSYFAVTAVTLVVGLADLAARDREQFWASLNLQTEKMQGHIQAVMADYARENGATALSYTREQADAISKAANLTITTKYGFNTDIWFDDNGFLVPDKNSHEQSMHLLTVGRLDKAIRQGTPLRDARSGPPGTVEIKGFGGHIRLDRNYYDDQYYHSSYDPQGGTSGSFYINQAKSSCEAE